MAAWNSTTIEALPTGKDHRDPGCPGLFIRVHPSGERAWTFRYSILGKDRRISLGLWPGVTIKQARDKADAFRIAVRDGRSPQQEVQATRAAWMTVTQLADRFEDEHLPSLKPTTQSSYKYILKNHIRGKLGPVLLHTLDQAALKAWRRTFHQDHTAFNRSLAVLRSSWNWGREEGLVTEPFPVIKAYPERTVQRFLTPEEMLRVLDVLEASTTMAAVAIRLIILTGARKGEIRKLRWTEIDETTGTATLKDHKTQAKGDKILFLAPEALVMLRALPMERLSEFVFPAGGKDGTLGSSLDKAWQAIRAIAKVPDVRLHDLRHTWASMGLDAGLTLPQVGAQLGHSTPAMTQKYAHLLKESGRKAAELVASRMRRGS